MVIAGKNALPSAFLVLRGFEDSIMKATEMGYNGVELALKNAEEVDPVQLSKRLNRFGMEVSCISTGQVFADSGLMFTAPDSTKRERVRRVFMEMIELIEKVNIPNLKVMPDVFHMNIEDKTIGGELERNIEYN